MFGLLKKLFSGKQVEQELPVGDNEARGLMRVAAALKEEKEYDQACEKMEEALQAKGADKLELFERLRYPSYLQLAGREEEGWQALNELSVTFVSPDSQVEITDQMIRFLLRGENYQEALMFTVWWLCLMVDHDRRAIERMIRVADNPPLVSSGEGKAGSKAYGETESGNPIRDRAYKVCSERYEEFTSLRGVTNKIRKLHKQAGRTENVAEMAGEVANYLKSAGRYDLGDVNRMFRELDQQAKAQVAEKR